VGCGCRGRALAQDLRTDGHAVRGTTRDAARTPALRDAGIEPWIGDPDRVGTLARALDSVTVVCWLLGGAAGDREALAALHGPRLRAFCGRIVDTTVRGFLYEAAGSVPADVLDGGAEIVREARRTWEIPVGFLDVDPDDDREWLRAAGRGVRDLLDAPS
jgi:hypothetical protein